jgi:hypothetical protein
MLLNKLNDGVVNKWLKQRKIMCGKGSAGNEFPPKNPFRISQSTLRDSIYSTPPTA